jgi:hypothetical protein
MVYGEGHLVASPVTDFDALHDPDVSMAEDYIEPDPSFTTPKKRTPNAKRYEEKIKGLLGIYIRDAVGQSRTAPDAALLLMRGPEFAEAWGDLAAHDKWVAKAVDWATDTAENPYAAAIIPTVAIVLQLIRNHEPVVEPNNAVTRGFRIPWTKRRVRLPIRIRLRWTRVRNQTVDPSELARYVFTNPKIRAAYEKQGVTLAPEFR